LFFVPHAFDCNDGICRFLLEVGITAGSLETIRAQHPLLELQD